ncbi:LysE family translocator [Pseudomonas viridiflava]|uniref:LysE family translocator n=1 Tax=Pseudomonas viridiflava TaxID=33069 RepID=A0ABU7N2G5_PSEVI|nr:LysE family translocator [Pseudomonas viridiflava]MBI6702074.1 LysE family translocator [Pseudomonas viridiflava]MBI6722521.1 LysE family translocator [Pseudomonas viridiflava]MEE3933992.1 LysE family translocator [Pseudomonas viridiflava]MEE4038751.1 LysE family translocator [Pseudomonas viridiflava]MEE4058733.1 LysE family translocator [Pseudomonas viridiflava]
MLSFLLFAFVASITPGPTNLLVLSNSARYGLKASLPIILGACMGAAGLVLLVGTGVGRSLMQVPAVQPVMAAIGVGWLTWLAWKIFNSPADPVSPDDSRPRLGFVGAAGLQVVNPKTWMMALAVVSVFSQGTVAHLALAFFLVSLPCLACWALLGAGSARLIKSARALQWLNRSMAVLLLVSAWGAYLH